jgi:hypothetical protein
MTASRARLVPPQTVADFKVGNRVKWLPAQAFGDHHHYDVLSGRVTAIADGQVVVTFEDGSTSPCDPFDLVKRV